MKARGRLPARLRPRLVGRMPRSPAGFCAAKCAAMSFMSASVSFAANGLICSFTRRCSRNCSSW